MSRCTEFTPKGLDKNSWSASPFKIIDSLVNEPIIRPGVTEGNKMDISVGKFIIRCVHQEEKIMGVVDLELLSKDQIHLLDIDCLPQGSFLKAFCYKPNGFLNWRDMLVHEGMPPTRNISQGTREYKIDDNTIIRVEIDLL
jgi:hypothetical protein